MLMKRTESVRNQLYLAPEAHRLTGRPDKEGRHAAETMGRHTPRATLTRPTTSQEHPTVSLRVAVLMLAVLVIQAPNLAWAQGTVSFRTHASGVDVPVRDTDGTLLAGNAFQAQLYVGPKGAAGGALQAVGIPVAFLTGANAGYVNGGTVSVPGIAGGVEAAIQMRVWETAYGTNFAQALAAGSKTGRSIVITKILGNPPFILAAALDGMQPFSLNQPPAITSQPQSHMILVESTATMGVTATGAEPLGYQWWFNSTALEGATGTNLTLTNAQLTNTGNYTVVVTNAYGSVTSAVAVLTVTPAGIPDQGWVVAWGDNSLRQTNVPAGLSNVVAVAGGYWHSLALRAEGTVVAWGDNSSGQTNVPAGLSNVTAIATGMYHSLALRSNGTVVGWGDGAPVVPAGLSNVVAVACGSWHDVALRSDGTVAGWGNLAVPAGLSNVVAIAAGGKQHGGLSSHSLALRRDGTVVEWGDYFDEILWINLPAAPPVGLDNVMAIACGTDHSLALRSNGTVVAWGAYSSGQTNVPAGLTNVVAIAGGLGHSLALRSDGTLVAWGDNSRGQTNTPSELFNVGAIAAGWFHSLAMTGTVGPSGVAPSITSQPQSRTNDVGTMAIFSVTAAGTAPLSYQWRFNSTNLAGATSASLVLSDVHLGNAGDYSVVVANAYGSMTSQVAILTVPPQPGIAPSIVVQPQSQTNLVGSTATLFVAADGTAPLAHQWRFNNTSLASATGTSLMLTSVQFTNAGDYTVVVTNAFGSVTSAVATLTVLSGDPPSITKEPQSQTLSVGEFADFWVAATGTTPLRYRWEKNGIPLTDGGNVYGTGGEWLEVLNVQTNDAGNYRVVITNAFGSVTSAVATLTVTQAGVAPFITSQPQSRTNLSGTTATFTVTATGTDPLSYQWRKGGANLADGGGLSGATTAALTLAFVQAADAGNYNVLVSNSSGSVTSQVAVLVVTVPQRPVGHIVHWGHGLFGQGDLPPGLTNAVAISAGIDHGLALKSDGTVVGWGSNAHGQTNVPAGLCNVVCIDAGDYHNLALKTDGTVAAWGENYWSAPTTNPPTGLSDVIAISGGLGHSLALKSNGTVVGWGYNAYGETNVPAGLSNVVAIAAGGCYSLALRFDRTVIAWGDNHYGQTNIPVGLSNVVAIAAGEGHGLALKSGGTVVAWGHNAYGQTNLPTGLSNVVAIAAGRFHNLALKSDGTVVGWGYNLYGETNPPAGLTNVIAIAAGQAFSLALVAEVPLIITVQPASQTVAAGANVSFSVTVVGPGPLSYQWRKAGVDLADGGNISGASTPILTLANVQTNHAGGYQVVITNAFGSVTSQVATLTISPAVPGTKRWEFATGDVVTSSPAIGADGTVYVGSCDRKLYALDGATGAKRWEFQTGSWVASAPAIGADGTVYVGSYDCKVYALNGATGAKRWEFATGSTVVNCPAIGVDGMVYVGSQDGKCYALDGATGQQRWAFATGGEVNCSPAIGADGTVYVGSLDRKLYALNGATGAKRWEFLTGNQIHSSPAIGADGTVYVGSYDKNVYALNGATGQQRWVFATGRYIWCGPTIGPDGTVYIGSHDYSVYALDGATGQRRWVFATGSYVGSSPAIGVDGTLYFGSCDGKLYALDSTSGQKRWEFAIGRDISPSPAIAADGTVYVGSHDGKVYALYSSSVGGPANSPWPMFHQNVRHAGRAGTASPSAPVITTQPASQTVAVGRSVTFGVIAVGTAPLAYQWRFNGTGLPAATNANLTLTNTGLADAGNYSVAVTNAFGSVTSVVATLTLTSAIPSIIVTGVGHDGYVANGTVFFDANRNSEQDEDEPYTTTDDQGHFHLEVPLDPFDTDQNGQLDPAEGCLVLKGGLDIATGLPLRTALTAPAGSTVVNPLTTLLREVLDQIPGLSVSNAQERVRAGLGVSNRVDLMTYDPFAGAGNNDPLAVPILRAAAQVQDTTVQIAALLEGASTNLSLEQSARLVTSALAARLATNASLVLSAPQPVHTLLAEAVSAAALTLGTNITDGAATIIAEVNQVKDQAAAAATNALQAAAEISRIEGLAQGSIANDLALAAAENKSIDDVLASNTGSGLTTQIATTPVGDVTGQETRPGTFAFSLPEFRVLEDGTPLAAVTVTRTDGNKWDVALRITLSDGTARCVDGDYSATNIYVQFADGQISQTVDLAPVLIDDAQVETNETIHLTLSLLPGAPPGTQIGTQNQAVVTIVDNDSPGTFAFTQASYRLKEDGTAVNPVTIRRDGGSGGEVSLLVTPIDIPGGAKPYEDYDPTPVTVRFLAGNMNRIVTIPVMADSLIEGDEPLQLALSLAAGGPAGASLGVRTSATLIIQDTTAVTPSVKLGILSAGPAGEFRFSVTGTAGRSCTVQHSTNLLDWVDQSTHVLGETPLVISEAQMQSTAQRFYRVVMSP
jgi:outer membrane protein assembly factor BamB/alpha-tubulin suppressor-like RCC1 family protein